MSSSEFHRYTRDEFLAEFYPDPADKAAIAAGMKQLRAEQRAFRLAEMRRHLGITQGTDLGRPEPQAPQDGRGAARAAVWALALKDLDLALISTLLVVLC
jgi:hypothetical protein